MSYHEQLQNPRHVWKFLLMADNVKSELIIRKSRRRRDNRGTYRRINVYERLKETVKIFSIVNRVQILDDDVEGFGAIFGLVALFGQL
jgi:hypothetical protein